VSALCAADVHLGQAHACDDPMACALGRLIDPDPRDAQLETMEDLLDRIEHLCGTSKAKVSEEIMAAIHNALGGPR
jgi:hypothetical protein